MALSYDKLWNILEQKNITKTEFRKMVDVSSGTLAKMTANEPISLSIVERICDIFQCDVSDLLEYRHEKKERSWKHIDEKASYHIELYYLYDPQWETEEFSGLRFLYGYAIYCQEDMPYRKQIQLEEKQSKSVYSIVGFRHNLSGEQLLALLSLMQSGGSFAEFLSRFDYVFTGFDESDPSRKKSAWLHQIIMPQPCVNRPEFMLAAQENLNNADGKADILSVIGKDDMYCESIVNVNKTELYQNIMGECNIDKMDLIREFVSGIDTLPNPEKDIMRIGDFEVLSRIFGNAGFNELCDVTTIVENEGKSGYKKFIKGLRIKIFSAFLKGEYTLEIIAYNQCSVIAHRLHDFMIEQSDLTYSVNLDESCSSVRVMLFSKNNETRFQLIGQCFYHIVREICIEMNDGRPSNRLHEDYKKTAGMHGVLMNNEASHKHFYDRSLDGEGNDPWRTCDNRLLEQFQQLYHKRYAHSLFIDGKEWEADFFRWLQKRVESFGVTDLWMTMGECSTGFILSLDRIARTAHVNIYVLADVGKLSSGTLEQWRNIAKNVEMYMDYGVKPMLISDSAYKISQNFIIIYQGRMVPDVYVISDYVNIPIVASRVSTDTSRQIVAYLFRTIQEAEENDSISYPVLQNLSKDNEITGDMSIEAADMSLAEVVEEVNAVRQDCTEPVLSVQKEKIVFCTSREISCRLIYKAFIRDFNRYAIIYSHCDYPERDSLKEYCVDHYDAKLSNILSDCLKTTKISVRKSEREALKYRTLDEKQSFDMVYDYVRGVFLYLDYPVYYMSYAVSLAHTIMFEADMEGYIKLLEDIYKKGDSLRFFAFFERLILHFSLYEDKVCSLAADVCLSSNIDFICAIGIYYYAEHHNLNCVKLKNAATIISKEYMQKLFKECVVAAQIERLRAKGKKDEKFEKSFYAVKELWVEHCTITRDSGTADINYILSGVEQRSYRDIYDFIQILCDQKKVAIDSLSQYIIELALRKVRQDYKTQNGFYHYSDFQNGDILLCALYNFSTREWIQEFLNELAQLEKQFIYVLHDVFLKEKDYRKWRTYMEALLWCRYMRKWCLDHSDNYEELVKNDFNRNVRTREVAGFVKKYEKDLEGRSEAYSIWRDYEKYQ